MGYAKEFAKFWIKKWWSGKTGAEEISKTAQDIEPKVFLLAKPVSNGSGIEEWLQYIDLMYEDVEDSALDNYLCNYMGESAEQVSELAGRRCYNSLAVGLNPNVTKIRPDSTQYHANVVKSGHGSVYEHGMFTFACEGVSRVFTHELVRHRVGTAFSQESLRYVRLRNNLRFWLPPIIKDNTALYYPAVALVQFYGFAQQVLQKLSGVEQMANFTDKKRLTSALRRFAPEGMATGIVFSANIRALRHMISLRTSKHAEYEIAYVFGQIAEIMKKEAPAIFVDMKVEYDPEEGLNRYTFEHEKI